MDIFITNFRQLVNLRGLILTLLKSSAPIHKNCSQLTVLFLLVLMIFGCSTLSLESTDSLQKPAQEKINLLLQQRAQQLNDISNWLLNARFSFITENEAWSGKLAWQQKSNNEYLMHFSDPAGQGVMQLSGNNEQVELRLADGSNYQAEDAETLLRQETNWDLPIKSLWRWIRALPDPDLPLKSEMDDQGLPAKFIQQGWEVSYQSYQQVDNRYFPRKINIKKDDLKLKLIVMNWMVE